MPQISITIDEALERRVRELAAEDHRSVSQTIALILYAYFEGELRPSVIKR